MLLNTGSKTQVSTMAYSGQAGGAHVTLGAAYHGLEARAIASQPKTTYAHHTSIASHQMITHPSCTASSSDSDCRSIAHHISQKRAATVSVYRATLHLWGRVLVMLQQQPRVRYHITDITHLPNGYQCIGCFQRPQRSFVLLSPAV